MNDMLCSLSPTQPVFLEPSYCKELDGPLYLNKLYL